MIIPKFSNTETEDSVNLFVYVPRFLGQHVEFYVDKSDFYLFAHPYCLKIRFPMEVKEQSLIYKPDTNTIDIVLKKTTAGSLHVMNFLNYGTEEKSYNYVPLLDVSHETELIVNQGVEEFDINKLEAVDSEPRDTAFTYGFSGKSTGSLENLEDGQSYVTVPIELFDAPHLIREARLAQEVMDFDYDIYQDHTYDTPQEIVNYEFKHPTGSVSKYAPVAPSSTKFGFSLLSQVCFAWTFENRVQCGDNAVTLGEMVRLYSPTLSWLDQITSLRLALHDTARRMLIYSGCRSWEVIDLAFEDFKTIITDRNSIMVALNRINKSMAVLYEPISVLYIEPLIGWLSVVPDNVYQHWIIAVKSLELNPELMCLFD